MPEACWDFHSPSWASSVELLRWVIWEPNGWDCAQNIAADKTICLPMYMHMSILLYLGVQWLGHSLGVLEELDPYPFSKEHLFMYLFLMEQLQPEGVLPQWPGDEGNSHERWKIWVQIPVPYHVEWGKRVFYIPSLTDRTCACWKSSSLDMTTSR